MVCLNCLLNFFFKLKEAAFGNEVDLKRPGIFIFAGNVINCLIKCFLIDRSQMKQDKVSGTYVRFDGSHHCFDVFGFNFQPVDSCVNVFFKGNVLKTKCEEFSV